jgi:pyruvate/2-oxoacid:ferredoxin oxidoreductase alpha subunit
VQDDIDRIESVLARVLTGAPVVTATDGKGQYITRESARALAELAGTDVADALAQSPNL